MKQEDLSKRAKEIGREIILKWCKTTFEGEMMAVLKKSCAIHAVRELTYEMDDLINDPPVVEKEASSVVESVLKEYINNTF